MAQLGADQRFDPRMALYLTGETTVEEVKAAAEEKVIGFKPTLRVQLPIQRPA